ncbi:MAG: hypothetical protein ACOC7K_02170, partial [bacterium]
MMMNSMLTIFTLCLLTSFAPPVEAGEQTGPTRPGELDKALLALHASVTKGETSLEVDEKLKRFAKTMMMTVRMDRCVRSFFEKPQTRGRLGTKQAAGLLEREGALKVVEFASPEFGFARQPFDATPEDLNRWVAILFGASDELKGLVRVLHERGDVVQQFKYVVRDDGERSRLWSLELDRRFDEDAWRLRRQNTEVFAFWSRLVAGAKGGVPAILTDVPGISEGRLRLLLVEHRTERLAEPSGPPVAYTLWFHSRVKADEGHVLAVDARMKRTDHGWRATEARSDPERMAAAKESLFLSALRSNLRRGTLRSYSQPVRRAQVLQDAKLDRVRRCVRTFFEADKEARPRLGQPEARKALSSDGPFRFIKFSSWICPKPRQAFDKAPGTWADFAYQHIDMWQQKLFGGWALVRNSKTDQVEKYEYVVRDSHERSHVVSVQLDDTFDGKEWELNQQRSEVLAYWRRLIRQPHDAREKALPDGAPGITDQWDYVDCFTVDQTIAKTNGRPATYAVVLKHDPQEGDREYKFLLAEMARRGDTWSIKRLSPDQKREQQWEEGLAEVALAKKLLRATAAELEALVLQQPKQVLDVLRRLKDPDLQMDRGLGRDNVEMLDRHRKFIAPLIKLLVKDIRDPETPPDQVPAVRALSLFGPNGKATDLVVDKFVQLGPENEHCATLETY